MIEYTPITVVYKTKRGAVKIETFKNLRCPDPLITKRSTKVPLECDILDIGVGKSFIEKYKKKYKKK